MYWQTDAPNENSQDNKIVIWFVTGSYEHWIGQFKKTIGLDKLMEGYVGQSSPKIPCSSTGMGYLGKVPPVPGARGLVLLPLNTSWWRQQQQLAVSSLMTS